MLSLPVIDIVAKLVPCPLCTADVMRCTGLHAQAPCFGVKWENQRSEVAKKVRCVILLLIFNNF